MTFLHAPSERNSRTRWLKVAAAFWLLVGNLGQELGAHNDAFRERLEAVLGHWQARVADCLRAAIRAGELPPETDAEALAGFFWIAWAAVPCANPGSAAPARSG